MMNALAKWALSFSIKQEVVIFYACPLRPSVIHGVKSHLVCWAGKDCGFEQNNSLLGSSRRLIASEKSEQRRDIRSMGDC